MHQGLVQAGEQMGQADRPARTLHRGMGKQTAARQAVGRTRPFREAALPRPTWTRSDQREMAEEGLRRKERPWRR